MNSHTGAIARFETRPDAIGAGFDVPLTEKEAAKLMAVENRDERLRMAIGMGLPVVHPKLANLPPLPGVTPSRPVNLRKGFKPRTRRSR
jgi:hypothetical protein